MKIKDAGNNQIGMEINYCSLMVGLHTEIDADTMAYVLIPFVRESYPNLDLEEIRNAFKSYAQQKLDFKEKPYNLISCAFIGSIMSSYSKYRVEQQRLHKSKENVQKALLEEPKVDYEKENFEFIKKIMIEEGVPPIIADWVGAYNYAIRENIINELDDKQSKLSQLKSKADRDYKQAKIMKQNYHHLASGATDSGVMVEFCKQELIKHFTL